MFTKYITSFIDGRIRIRHSALHNPNTSAKVQAFLQKTAGVKTVNINTVTASLLLEYDSKVLSRMDLLQLAGQLKGLVGDDEEEEPEKPKPRSRKSRSLLPRARVRKITNMGMIATLGLCVGLGLTGRTRGHVAFGWGFLFFNAIHVFMYRKSL